LILRVYTKTNIPVVESVLGVKEFEFRLLVIRWFSYVQ